MTGRGRPTSLAPQQRLICRICNQRSGHGPFHPTNSTGGGRRWGRRGRGSHASAWAAATSVTSRFSSVLAAGPLTGTGCDTGSLPPPPPWGKRPTGGRGGRAQPPLREGSVSMGPWDPRQVPWGSTPPSEDPPDHFTPSGRELRGEGAGRPDPPRMSKGHSPPPPGQGRGTLAARKKEIEVRWAWRYIPLGA